jgi:beta-galactosidase
LTGENLPTLVVQAEEKSLQVSALPYTDEILNEIEYSVDLPESSSTVLNVAGRTLGVGSNGCGPRPLQPYLLWSSPGEFSYILRLLPVGEHDYSTAARQAVPKERAKPHMPALDEASHTPQGKVIAVSSYEPGEGEPEHAVDGDPSTFWHSRWSTEEAKPPHFLVVDYGHSLEMSGLGYTARTDSDNGHIKDFEIYVSDDGIDWGSPMAKGSFSSEAGAETIRFPGSVKARFLKFVALSEQRGRSFATIAELRLIEANSQASQAQTDTAKTTGN